MRRERKASTKKPSKTKKRKETKIEAGRKMRGGKHLQAAFQSIIFSRVLDTRERVCNFAVVIIIITAIIIIRVMPVRRDGKADGKGRWRRIKCQIGETGTLPGGALVKCTETEIAG